MSWAILISPVVPAAALNIDLKTAPGEYAVLGAAADDYTAQTVAFGDVNGDGRNDLIIGARGVDYMARSSCGAVYVVLSSDTLTSRIDLSLARDDVVHVYGPASDSQLGARAACGDVNGDGRDDIVCGVPSASPNGKSSAGEIFVVYGADPLPAVIDLGSPGPGVTVIQGENVFDKLGESLSVGDINGDTVSDILAGAPFATAEGRSLAGTLFVVYGGVDLSLAQTVDLALPTWAGLRVLGSRANDTFGTACLAVDVTGDGTADILAGAPQAAVPGRVSAGIGYLIPGGPSLPDTIDTLDDAGPPMVKFLGAAANALNASAFGTADADGDMVTDLLIASPQLSPGGRSSAGAIYVLNGAVGYADTVDLATPPAATTRIDGPQVGVKMGRSLAAADLNFDGLDDVIIGLPTASPIDPVSLLPRNEAGKTYIVFGRSVFPDVLDLAAEQTGITAVLGAVPLDRIGNSVAAGYFDDDGFEDVFIGAYNAARGGTFSVGKAYLLLGNPGITPTVLVFSDATAQPGRVRLEWLLRDDLEPDEFAVFRAVDPDDENGERLSPSGLARLGAARYEYVDVTARAGETYTYTVETTGADPQTLLRATLTVPLHAAAAFHQSVPNPFRDRTALTFDIPQAGRVALRIYDVRGALVASVTDAEHSAGGTTLFWDGRDEGGAYVTSGVYFARMEYGGKTYERKVSVVR